MEVVNFFVQIFRGLFRLIFAGLRGILYIAEANPKRFAWLIIITVFVLALMFVRGFGDIVANIGGLIFTLWLLKLVFLGPSKKKKKR